VVTTDTPAAREELERLVHEYRRLREEHRRARRGGRRRRRLGTELRELDARFEHVLTALPLEDATRREWRDHLHQRSPAPSAPASETPLPLEQGASEHWPAARGEVPVSVRLRGDLPAAARDDLERALGGLQRLTGRPLQHVRGTLERLHDPALPRPVLAKATVGLGRTVVRARAAAATPAEAIDLLEARLRRNLLDLAEREQTSRRRGAPGAE
jgi:ribosome-associated translation inhibitor RaiA